MERKPLFDRSLLWVQMTLAGCGSHEEVCVLMCVCVCVWWKVARIVFAYVCFAAAGQEVRASAVATTFSALSMPSHLSLVAEVQKTTAEITRPRCWIKSSLYPQKSRINMKNVNVCAEREEKKTS